MDQSPNVLAETVRAKRIAVDNDLELLRLRVSQWDPRRMDIRRWGGVAVSSLAAAGLIYWWARRRRRARSTRFPAGVS